MHISPYPKSQRESKGRQTLKQPTKSSNKTWSLTLIKTQLTSPAKSSNARTRTAPIGPQETGPTARQMRSTLSSTQPASVEFLEHTPRDDWMLTQQSVESVLATDRCFSTSVARLGCRMCDDDNREQRAYHNLVL